MNLEISNFTKHKIDKKYFKKVGKAVLGELKMDKDTGIGLVFVGEKRMRTLNKNYRGINKVTDVLSFPAGGGNFDFAEFEGDKEFLGEILVCVPQAQKQSRKQSYPLKRELTTLFVHGILHLAGYEDEKNKDYQRMIRKQKDLLVFLGF